MHHAACLSATGAASCSSSGPSGIRKSLSCGNMAQLALAAQHQQHLLHHTAAPSRLRPNMPRAGSFASLNGAVSYGAETSRMQEQRTEQATSTATEASRLQKAALKSQPYASLTRVFLIGQPQNLVRGLAGRKFRAAGPVSLLLFLFGMILAIIAGVRSVLVRRVKSCKSCMGYGITRCRLCNGDGSVEWTGKSNHQEMCPLCMTKRYVTCSDCGGFYHRPLFAHVQPNAKAGVPEFLRG